MIRIPTRSPSPRADARAQRRGGVRWWVVLAFLGYAAWYWLSHQQEAAFTGRSQLIDTSHAQEAQLGLQAWDEILASEPVLRGGPEVARVDAITRRLVARAPELEQLLAEARGVAPSTAWDAFAWESAVIDSPQANAFCLPGGKLAVYTGLLPVAGNDDALAVVMGHEVAHALLRHGGERMAQQKLVRMGALAGAVAVGEMEPTRQAAVMAALGAGSRYGVLLPFSRAHESEADALGLLLAAAACYDPREAPGLWERMGAGREGGAPPAFASSHPGAEERIARLQALMPDALAVRERFCGAR